MITIKMTEAEYKAYLLYLKSVEMMRNSEDDSRSEMSLDQYLADPEKCKDLESGFEDVKAGRITYVDPEKLWESIK